jgi:hypothetical protein
LRYRLLFLHGVSSVSCGALVAKLFLGFISYNGNIEVHVSLLNAVLYEKPQIQRDH